MPIVDITILGGRSYEQKLTLIKEVTAATVRSLEVKPEQVRVIVREVHPSLFAVGGKPRGLPEDGA
jgi:4-oxalocrotonate tautomerase